MKIEVEITKTEINKITQESIIEIASKKVDSLFEDIHFRSELANKLADLIESDFFRRNSIDAPHPDYKRLRTELLMLIVDRLPQDKIKDKLIEALILNK